MGNEQSSGTGDFTESDIAKVFTFPGGLDRGLRRKFERDSLPRHSILKKDDPERKDFKTKLDKKCLTQAESRAVGCVVGNAVGDALGAPLEFSTVRYGSKELKEMGQPEVWNRQGYNRFRLKSGQWTDDAAMGLCLADSLLVNGDLNPYDLRLRFLNWWEFGYNNAFGYDKDRRYGCGSVGLGGNIGSSMREFEVRKTPFTTAGNRKTSGNGSLMRNGPVPARFWNEVEDGMKAAYKQSKTTHQGDESAECCRLLTYICCTAISTPGNVDVKALLDSLPSKFESDHYSITCLAAGKQEEHHADNDGLDLADRNWTWKNKDFEFAPGRSKQMPGYIGSYAMDNLSMSLHCIYNTTSAKEAMLYCANMRGDSDSVCAVVGQMAGAIYGLEAIPTNWIKEVERWDGGGSIALRGYKLFKAGERKDKSKAAGKAEEKRSQATTTPATTAQTNPKPSKMEVTLMSTDDQVEETGVDKGGYAPALNDCKHADTHIKQISHTEAKLLLTNAKCEACDTTELKNLWVCMGSKKVFCGRYAKGHMAKHCREENHHIALCMGDLSFWCYKCNSYLHHLTIRPVYDAYDSFHKAKFGEPVSAPFNEGGQ